MENVFMVSTLQVGNEVVFVVRDRTTQVAFTSSNPNEVGNWLLNAHISNTTHSEAESNN